jgi:S-formylglutathione hydrolase FrmB
MRMPLAEVRFYGNSIGVSASMNVIFPDSGKGPWPVFYLLHGLSDDHSMWCRRSNIERHVANVPMIVVMPSVLRGWYTNSIANKQYAYEDHIIKDVVPLVDRMYPTIASRKGRVVGGLSMGGYGAVKLALKFPEMFCSSTSHSGALMIMHEERKNAGAADDWKKELLAIFGARHKGGPNDLVALAKKCPPKLRPALRIDCGVDDFLIQDNRRFHDILEKTGYAHEYQEFPGAHTWDYWDLHVQEAIAFHRRALKI